MPSHVFCATTLNCGGALAGPFAGPLLLGGGSPGALAGAIAFALMCTVPSSATERMSSFVLSELNVIECGPMMYQVTEPPTGILIFDGPNSVISASCALSLPEPASTTFFPGSVMPGIGGLPCRSAVTAGASLPSRSASCF